MLPMIRGRMTHINGAAGAGAGLRVMQRGEGFAQREQNLTWAAEIGPDNIITEGKWFTAADARQAAGFGGHGLSRNRCS